MYSLGYTLCISFFFKSRFSCLASILQSVFNEDRSLEQAKCHLLSEAVVISPVEQIFSRKKERLDRSLLSSISMDIDQKCSFCYCQFSCTLFVYTNHNVKLYCLRSFYHMFTVSSRYDRVTFSIYVMVLYKNLQPILLRAILSTAYSYGTVDKVGLTASCHCHTINLMHFAYSAACICRTCWCNRNKSRDTRKC